MSLHHVSVLQLMLTHASLPQSRCVFACSAHRVLAFDLVLSCAELGGAGCVPSPAQLLGAACST